MEIAKEIKWTNDLEEFFKATGEKSYSYGILHKMSEKKYDKLKTYIEIPIIVLTSISGTMSISSSSLFEGNEKAASIVIGSLSLFCGVLSTINSYFSFSKRAEGHRVSNIEYIKLYRFLDIEMKLPRHERMEASDLLKITQSTFERLSEISPLIDVDIIDNFKKKYVEYTTISFPAECNGLESIKIFVDDEKDDEKDDDKRIGSLSLSI